MSIYDLIPGGGPALAGIHDRRSLFKGAQKPDDPPPVTAPVRADESMDGEASRQANRRKGIARTILDQPMAPTLGAKSTLGIPASTPYANGGEG